MDMGYVNVPVAPLLSVMLPHCYMPMASQQTLPSPCTVKPFVLMPLAHGQFPLSQVHTTLANELNAMGNVA